mgnify:CR=1 FL=1
MPREITAAACLAELMLAFPRLQIYRSALQGYDYAESAEISKIVTEFVRNQHRMRNGDMLDYAESAEIGKIVTELVGNQHQMRNGASDSRTPYKEIAKAEAKGQECTLQKSTPAC